ncbi:MAG: eukaryotic-like serine/threonine-protein kinase [Thermoleophilaceae bacterium]|nr:eukaryotic-like serine/threonine-protein kinase [Thermoleophilaceae bacterium]
MSTPTEIGGRYALERRLGAGGMSTVFLARDAVLERLVAVKLLAEHLSDDEDFVARFRREALAAARLQHPNIVQVFDSGEDAPSSRHFIVMEYVNGPSCADLLREQRQLSTEQTVEIVRGSCHGLDYAHRAGVIHRDVKPGNLLVSDESGTVKLADFGIAKAAEQTRITQVGAVLGTAAYLSPEQATGEEAEAASDIYSLGVCAYQFLTGRLPHEYSSLTELALKQQRESVVPITEFRPDVQPELDYAIRVALERDPAHRYVSALAMAAAIEAGARGEETGPTAAFSTTGTQLLGSDDDATQALPSTRALRQPAPYAEPTAPPARRERTRPPARKQSSGGRAKYVALALILVLAAVGIAILVSGSSGSGYTDINAGSPRDQANELINYIRAHRK